MTSPWSDQQLPESHRLLQEWRSQRHSSGRDWLSPQMNKLDTYTCIIFVYCCDIRTCFVVSNLTNCLKHTFSNNAAYWILSSRCFYMWQVFHFNMLEVKFMNGQPHISPQSLCYKQAVKSFLWEHTCWLMQCSVTKLTLPLHHTVCINGKHVLKMLFNCRQAGGGGFYLLWIFFILDHFTVC